MHFDVVAACRCVNEDRLLIAFGTDVRLLSDISMNVMICNFIILFFIQRLQ